MNANVTMFINFTKPVTLFGGQYEILPPALSLAVTATAAAVAVKH